MTKQGIHGALLDVLGEELGRRNIILPTRHGLDIVEALAEAVQRVSPSPVLRGRIGRDCAVHRHREDVPTEDHHIWPIYAGGPVSGPKVRLCANGHGSLHDLLTRIERAGGYTKVPAKVRRRYGWRIRRLALKGWQQYGKEIT